jgi:hypothetical protein
VIDKVFGNHVTITFAGGMWGDISAHCKSVRSEGYRLRRTLASMPLLSAATLQRRTRHFAHGL